MADKQRRRRPFISAPFGVIKSSHPYDLVRSEELVVVDTIKDCRQGNSEGSFSSGLPSSLDKRLVASPTVASISIPVPQPHPQPSSSSSSRFLRRPSFPSFGKCKSSKLLLPASATTTRLPVSCDRLAEQLPPLPTVPLAAEPQRLPSKLPRSRTMNVLNDLKKSISRSSLTARSDKPPLPSALPRFSAPVEARSRVSSEAPKSRPVPPRSSLPAQKLSGSTRMLPPPPRASSSFRFFSPRAPVKAPSPPKPPLLPQAHSTRSVTPEPDGSQVVTAQPLEYWTGRFSRLNDIHLGANCTPETLLTLWSGLESQKRPVNAQSISGEDARHLYILAQLDFLCATPEARQSLHEFQLVFARRFNRPILLPEGSSMQGDNRPDRSIVGRIFNERAPVARSLGAPRSQEAAAVQQPRSGSSTLLRCLYGSGVPSKALWRQEPRRYRGWIHTMI